MRLLHSKKLELTEFFGNDIPPYAILSHTWDDEEVTFQDIQLPRRKTRKGFAKILSCCKQAVQDGLDWVWVDTCCIDKSSSAELSEAINSMYAWYGDSTICYAYLADVSSGQSLSKARWFTRGWCLQELIAPLQLEFYAKDWTELGTKSSLCSQVSDITGICSEILLGASSPRNCNVGERMSWASQRMTSRVEDMAYCLLGLFDVHMPLLYGEGKRAFLRLQEAILAQTEDHTMLLWTPAADPTGATPFGGVLCDAPKYFLRTGFKAQLSDGTNRLCRYSDLRVLKTRTNVQRMVCHPGIQQALGSTSLAIALREKDPRGVLAIDPPMVTPRGIRITLFTKEIAGVPSHNRTAWVNCWTPGNDPYLVLLPLHVNQPLHLIPSQAWRDTTSPLILMRAYDDNSADTDFKTYQLEEIYLANIPEGLAMRPPHPGSSELFLDLQFSILAPGCTITPQIIPDLPLLEQWQQQSNSYRLHHCPEKIFLVFRINCDPRIGCGSLDQYLLLYINNSPTFRWVVVFNGSSYPITRADAERCVAEYIDGVSALGLGGGRRLTDRSSRSISPVHRVDVSLRLLSDRIRVDGKVMGVTD